MVITLPQQSAGKNLLFSKLIVADTMRRQVVTLTVADSIAVAIRTLIKFKNDAILVTDDQGLSAGVVTKTEIMGAYYADMPQDTALADIMGSPVICCSANDSLESALITMQQSNIHRIYVNDETGQTSGTLSYPDIVGSLYRFCCDCEYGLRKRTDKKAPIKLRYSIREVMTSAAATANVNESIRVVIEKLATLRLGALLLVDDELKPSGVVSKTDLALAFCRNVPLDATARAIMNTPVRSCSCESSLEDGVRKMIFSEISRLFIYETHKDNIIGVLSLSDAARIRSGSCQACSTSRIRVKDR